MKDQSRFAEHAGRERTTQIFCGLICLALIAGAGCSRVREIDDDPIVATYKNGTVTVHEFDRWLAARNLTEPPGDLLPEINELVLVKVLAAKGVDEGLADDPTIAHKLEDAEKATLERALKRHTAASVTVSDEEIAAIVANEPLGFDKPRRARLRNLFKRFPPGSSEEDRAEIRRRMEELHDELAAGADMVALALAESDSETRYRGGLMGTIDEGQLPPALDAIVMGLREGEISEIIENRDGLTIIQCDAAFAATKIDADEVRAKVEANLTRSRRRQALADLEAELLATADLEISMDLALDPTTGSDQTVATLGTHSITRGRLEELAAARLSSPRRVRDLSETRARTILESYAVTSAAADRARGLDLVDGELMSSVQHQQAVILATEELSRRIGLRFFEPTSTEVEAYFEANRADFRSLPEVDLEMIRFPFTSDSLPQVHRRANLMLDAIESHPSDFGTIARQRADEDAGSGEFSKLTLTTRQLAAYGPAVGKAVQSLETGDVSGLIRQENDLWIIKLVEKRRPRRLEYEETGDMAHTRLGQQRVDEILAAVENEVLTDLGIELVGD